MRLIQLVKAFFTPGSPVYRGGPCRETLWRRAFPDASQRQVRGFLATFAEAFAYPSREKLKFRPDEAVYQVYRARYRLSGWAHSEERESLARLMEKRYHVELSDLWSETLTLGELFEAARTKGLDRNSAGPGTSAAPHQQGTGSAAPFPDRRLARDPRR